MDRSPGSRFGHTRRTVMKGIGAGAGISVIGGTAAAHTNDSAVTYQEDDDEADDGTNGSNTVHSVQTLISGPPTNPERPADFYYQPTGIHVQPSDVIRFVFTTPDHNVVSYHPAFGMRRRVPTGVAAFSSPLLGFRPESIPGDMVDPPAGEEGGESGEEDESDADGESKGPVPDTWLASFETPGVYDLVCSPHEVFGMAMRVVVGDVTEVEFETEDPDSLPEPRAGPVGLSRVTLTDPALRPEAIVDAGTVEWESLESVQSGGGDGE